MYMTETTRPRARAAIRKLDAGLLINEMQPMSMWVERAQSVTRFSPLLIDFFAATAAILAGVGLYGVLATFVRQRRSSMLDSRIVRF
jgi:putative ABC transport system permease protein